LFLICNVAYAQKNKRYIVLDVPKTIIKTKIELLNMNDTVNKNRGIGAVPECLGGSKPLYPMASSYESISGYEYEFMDCLKKNHTLSGHCWNYLIKKNDSILEINSKEKFKEIFAPVDDKEEALAFAFALCNIPHIKAIYNFSFLNDKGTDYEIFRKELIPTSVKETENGYEVVLFSTYFGCTAYCSEAIIFVSKAGDVRVIKTESLFHDKAFTLIID